METVAAFILVLGIIIFFHEFGHFITAKAFGMRVFVFSFGFGKRLVGFKWGDTDCRVSLVPLGGYVKLEGEPDDHVSEDTSMRGDGRDFTARPRWQRFVVYLAGPFMNLVLTLSVLTALHMIGFGVDATLFDRPIVGAVEPDSPAATAGLLVGDEIVSIDANAQTTWEGVRYNILVRPDALVKLTIRRGVEERELEVRSSSMSKEKLGTIGGVYPLVRIGLVVPGAPAQEAGLRLDDAILRIGDTPVRSFSDIPPLVQGAGGKPLALSIFRDGQILEIPVVPREGRIGIGSKTVIRKFGLPGAVLESCKLTVAMTRQTFDILGRLLTARLSIKTMSGPLGIAQQSGDAARAGPGALLTLVAMISLQVGILNLFPLAPLDGGHLAILLGEGLLRRDFSLNVKTWIMNAGALVIFALIGVVLYSDLSKTSFLGRYLP